MVFICTVSEYLMWGCPSRPGNWVVECSQWEVHVGHYSEVQWNLYIVVTLGPTFCGCIIEGGCIIEVHNTLAVCTLGPNKVALLERLAAIE